MKEEVQNLAVAKWCGIVSEDQHGMVFHTEEGFVRNCPDYVNDLNAISLAEDKLDDVMQFKYACELETGATGCFAHVTANSKRRTAALLRVVGLWQDELTA